MVSLLSVISGKLSSLGLQAVSPVMGASSSVNITNNCFTPMTFMLLNSRSLLSLSESSFKFLLKFLLNC